MKPAREATPRLPPRLTLLCDRRTGTYSLNLHVHADGPKARTASRWKRALVSAVAGAVPRFEKRNAGRSFASLFFNPDFSSTLESTARVEPFGNRRLGFRIRLPVDEIHLPSEDHDLEEYLRQVAEQLQKSMNTASIQTNVMPISQPG